MDFVISLFFNWICGAIFALIGFSCTKSRKPVGFWSGIEVKKSEVTDVKKYNFANAVMWCAYSAFFWLAGFIAIGNATASAVIDIIACTVGLVGLIIGYSWIKHRYFVSYRDRYVAGRLNDYK